MITTAGEIKKILKDVNDDATLLFSVDVSSNDGTAFNRLQQTSAVISIDRYDLYNNKTAFSVIFSLFDMDKNF